MRIVFSKITITSEKKLMSADTNQLHAAIAFALSTGKYTMHRPCIRAFRWWLDTSSAKGLTKLFEPINVLPEQLVQLCESHLVSRNYACNSEGCLFCFHDLQRL